jgi:L-fucose isomerase-like protein
MDMDPMTIKGVWGFNGTERPGAVYLASVLASHAQKGLPAFGIYGHDVQNLDEVTNIPEDVQEKLLRFARSAVAVATMRGKSYLQIGSICMGIGGSIIDSDFIESYLGMRVESVDEVEIIRRMSEGIYDAEEVAKCRAWIKENWPRVQVSPEVRGYMMDIVEKTRRDSRFVTGVSTRGAIALYRAAQVTAALEGRDYVLPEDVRKVSVPVLAHRISTGSAARSGDAREYLKKLVEAVPVPLEALN